MTDERPNGPAAYLFLDLETTGLDPERDAITQIAWIIGDEKHSYYVDYDGFPSLWSARHTAAVDGTLTRVPLKRALELFFDDCLTASQGGEVALLLVGAVPSFDDAFLRKQFRETPYHYQLIDVQTLVMGALGLDRPPHLHECRNLLGIAGENEKPHDALYDALEAKLIFEAILARRSGD